MTMMVMVMVMVMMIVDDWGESTLLGFDDSNNSRGGSVSDSKISQIRSRLFHGSLFREKPHFREILLAFSSRKTGKIEKIYSLNF